MKKTDNKGFSLVELIVVIAIMAVLVGVLAPALLRYVEKSRVATDNSALSEVASAIKTAAANETIYDYIVGETNGATVTIDNTGKFTSTTDKLSAEVIKTVGTTLNFKSKKYKTDGQIVTFTVKASSTTDAIEITQDNYYESSDATVASKSY
jgi:type IV pilus assembly protein PilA